MIQPKRHLTPKTAPIAKAYNHLRAKKTSRKKIDATEINAFIVWVKTLSPAAYPIQSQVIKQLQSYGANSRINSVLTLYALYRKGK